MGILTLYTSHCQIDQILHVILKPHTRKKEETGFVSPTGDLIFHVILLEPLLNFMITRVESHVEYY